MCVGVLLRSAMYAFTHRWDREMEERKREREGGREREREGWLIRTCVMTIVNHLLNGTDTQGSLPGYKRKPRISIGHDQVLHFVRPPPDNSPRYQLIPCLPCFELELRFPSIDEISFPTFPSFRLLNDLYLF